MKIVLIDAKGMDQSQPIGLSGCPIEGNFRAKRAKNPSTISLRFSALRKHKT